jgi:murein DD-endopeptidase MepM/ murein hydrolase activator NlpD
MVTSEDGKVSTYYMHLDSFADISQGDYVKEGTIIGYIGGSGAGIQDKYSPHLHYEVIIDGVHVNPVIGDNILLDPQKIDAL